MASIPGLHVWLGRMTKSFYVKGVDCARSLKASCCGTANRKLDPGFVLCGFFRGTSCNACADGVAQFYGEKAILLVINRENRYLKKP
jgi:hypothetical protein